MCVIVVLFSPLVLMVSSVALEDSVSGTGALSGTDQE